MIQITEDEIDPQQLLNSVHSDHCGATVLFLGTTRSITADKVTTRLEYECYREMAEKELEQLVQQANHRWDVEKVTVVHRIGVVEVGQASVGVAVGAPHRAAAFEAASWLIDTLKQVVPIWKRENWADGTTEWVHPGLDES